LDLTCGILGSLRKSADLDASERDAVVMVKASRHIDASLHHPTKLAAAACSFHVACPQNRREKDKRRRGKRRARRVATEATVRRDLH